MSENKCKACRANAEWKFNSERYCEDRMRTKFNVMHQDVPRVCEMCGTPIHREYYLDDEDNPFCSAKCALEYNGASELEEERDED